MGASRFGGAHRRSLRRIEQSRRARLERRPRRENSQEGFRVKATMILADAAQVAEGKLFILGGGWSVTSGKLPSAARDQDRGPVERGERTAHARDPAPRLRRQGGRSPHHRDVRGRSTGGDPHRHLDRPRARDPDGSADDARAGPALRVGAVDRQPCRGGMALLVLRAAHSPTGTRRIAATRHLARAPFVAQ